MNGFDPTATSPPATMRDIQALRSDLVEVAEEASRQTLAAHTRTLALLAEHAELAEEREQDASLFRAEVRSRHEREDERARLVDARMSTMLRHLERLVDVPATERETLSPPTWQGRLSTWLARPASTRAVLALAAAGVLATLSGCVAILGGVQ